MTRLTNIRFPAARAIRQLHHAVARAEHRLAKSILPGKVKPGSQDLEKRTVQLILAIGPDGEEVLSPPVRWQQPGAGTTKIHAVPADNEQMTLQSPSGTIGTGSMAVWGTYDDDSPPPTDKADETVIQYGEDTTIRLSDDLISGRIGEARFAAAPNFAKIRAGEVYLIVDAELGQITKSPHPLLAGDDPFPNA